MQIDPKEKRDGIDWWIKRGVDPEMIDHDPKEPKIDRKPESFVAIFALVAFAWFGIIYAYGVDWRSAALGGLSGMVFVLWASLKFKHIW